MEVSSVRRRLNETIERAKRRAAERRVRSDAAGVAFGRFLENTAIPLFRQIVNVLRADGYPFSVITPSGSVRLTSDRWAQDFVEVLLDTSGDEPQLMLHASRGWGGGVGAHAPCRGPLFGALDGFVQASANAGDFH